MRLGPRCSPAGSPGLQDDVCWTIGYQARRGDKGKAVLRKQNSVTKSYERKARKADVKYNGHDPNDESDGPIVVHLKTFGRVLGLAAGPHDVSPDFKAYIKRLAAKAGAKRSRTLGARSAREATALYYSTFRREVSIVLARTMSRLMYTRLHLVVYGNDNADRTRHQYNRNRSRSDEDDYYNRHGPQVNGIGQPHRHGGRD